ncbi:MAG TPA: hypothetical protein VFV42_06980 [Acidimicrobiales bacterium]|nr:hypothetical protein [Acidimicrobiales bacterium]
MRPTTKKLLALSASLSLGLAACGTDEVATPAVSGEAAAVEETTTTTEAAPVASEPASADDPASTLRSTLTSLLQEHVYLAGAALETALDLGADDPSTEAALAALDENTLALGGVIGSVPGVDSPDDFVQLWQDHIGYFVDYAVARAGEDQDGADQALADLEGYQQETADMLESLTDGELLADEVFGELETHVTMITDTVDALVDEDPEALTLLRDAATHMDAVAFAIAEGVVSAHDEIPGEVASVPAETRATLTSGLQEQAYLLILAAEQVVEAGGPEDPAVQAAVTLAEGSGEDLANTVGSATGTDEREAFLDVWRPHVEAVLAYAEAAATGGDTGAARGELDAASAAVATTLGGLVGVDLGAGIDQHVQTVTAAIDALAAADPAAWSLGRAAAQVMPSLAATLAPAISAASAAGDAASGQGTEGGAESDAGAGTTSGGGSEGSDSAGGGSASGGSAEGGATSGGSTAGGTTEDIEPASDPSEDGSPTAEGG